MNNLQCPDSQLHQGHPPTILSLLLDSHWQMLCKREDHTICGGGGGGGGGSFIGPSILKLDIEFKYRKYKTIWINQQTLTTCQHFRSLQIGEGNIQKRKITMPKINKPAELISRLSTMAPASFFLAIAVPMAHNSHTNILCTINTEILCHPIELGCGNLTC